MAKAKKPVKNSTKKPSKAQEREQEIELAAKKAAQETLESLSEDNFLNDEEDDMDLEFDGAHDDTETDIPLSMPLYDIFEEAFRKAQALGDSPKFLIKKDGQFIASMTYPCSWERIQQRFGGGHYQVQARRASNGLILKNATEMIGEDPDAKKEVHETIHQEATNQPSFLEFMTLLNTTQEKAEQKAREAAIAAQSSNNLMLQTVMQMQAQAQQQFQAMMMELNKQSQNQQQQQQALMTTIMSSLLAKKEGGEGFTAMSVMKMIQDASRDAEQRTKSWYELVEKKAEVLAEEKAQAMSSGSDENESLTKSVIKGFVPVLSQIMAAQGQGAPQVAPPQQAPRQLAGPVVRPNPNMPQNMAPGVPKYSGSAAPGVPAAPSVPATPQQVQKTEIASQSVNVDKMRVVGPAMTPASKEKPTNTEELELKNLIINELKGDIAQAFMLKKSAAKTAEACLKKLEKKGVMRQTVLDTFTIEDFFALASQYGVLDQAKPWITEFYEAIKAPPTISKAKSGTQSTLSQ